MPTQVCNSEPADCAQTRDARSWRVSPAVYLALLTFAAFLLRLAMAQWATGGLSHPYVDDEISYTRLSRELLAGHGYIREGAPTSLRTPVLPLVAAATFWVAGDRIVPLRILMCFIGALLVPAIYLATKSILSSRAAWLAAIVAVVFPNWAYLGGAVLTDVPAAVLACVTVYFLVQFWRANSIPYLAAAGITLAIVALTRPSAIAFFVATVVWLILTARNWRRRLIDVLVLTASFSLLVAPWCVRNYYAQGRFVFISAKTGSEMWKSTNPYATGICSLDAFSDKRIFFADKSLSEAELNTIYKQATIKFIKENPKRFFELAGIKFIQFWKLFSPRMPLLPNLVVFLSFGPVLALFIVRLVQCGWRRGPEMLLALMIMALTCLHMIFTSTVRYRLPIEPLCLIMALGAISSWTNLLNRNRPGTDAQPVLAE